MTTLPRLPSSLLVWLIRRVEVIRGSMHIRVECAPAFNYARSPHTTSIEVDTSVAAPEPTNSPTTPHLKAVFDSPDANLKLYLRYIAKYTLDDIGDPEVKLEYLDLNDKGHKGRGVWTEILLRDGQPVR